MKLKKIRNALLVVLTLALVSATAVAITWAFTEGSFGDATNTFTNEDITAELTEWEWDGKPSSVDPDKTNHTETIIGTSNLGETIAGSYSPNQTIPKNPSISNISDLTTMIPDPNDDNPDDGIDQIHATDPQEWVAMTIRYYIKNGDDKYYFPSYDAFKDALAAVKSDKNANGFNEIDWTVTQGSFCTTCYYNSLLDNYAMTATVFDDVVTNTKAKLDLKKVDSNYTYTGLKKMTSTGAVTSSQTCETTGYPEFHIELQGYAVQGDNLTQAQAKTELDKLIAADPITIALK